MAGCSWSSTLDWNPSQATWPESVISHQLIRAVEQGEVWIFCKITKSYPSGETDPKEHSREPVPGKFCPL